MGGPNVTHHDPDQADAAGFVPVGESFTRSGDLRCPHCGAAGQRRTSREVTPTHREIFYICRNVACGHSWKASLSYEYGLSPSAIPDPAVTLPLRPLERAAVLTALADASAPEPDPNQPRLFD